MPHVVLAGERCSEWSLVARAGQVIRVSWVLGNGQFYDQEIRIPPTATVRARLAEVGPDGRAKDETHG